MENPSKHLSLRFFPRAVLIIAGVIGLMMPGVGQTPELASAPCANGSGLIGLRQLITNSAVQAIAVADFNRDGKADLALSEIKNASPVLPISRISIWFGDGQGLFEPITRFDAPAIFTKLDAGDLNKDGIADLVGSGAGFGPASGAAALLGNGDGTFTFASSITAGAGPVTSLVADFDGDGRDDVVIGSLAFNRSVIALSGADGKLGTPAMLTLPAGTRLLNVGDFNGDGKKDLVALVANRIIILLNDGSGRFTSVPGPEITGAPQAVAAGEFNGDGKADVAVVLNNSVMTFRGDGQGGLSAPQTFSDKGGTFLIARDFNGDGKDDLVLGNSGVTLLLNDGAGNFNTPSNFGTDYPPAALIAADLNGDGKADVATASPTSNGLSLLFNQGDGPSIRMLQSPPITNFSQLPLTARISDLNKDNKPDLIVTDSHSQIVIALGDGRGGFGTPRRIESGIGVQGELTAVAVADFNKDGNSDLAIAGPQSFPDTGYAVVVMFGNGSGNFDLGQKPHLLVGDRPADILAGDFNNDGAPDIATANAGSNAVSLLLDDGHGGFNVARSISAGLEPRSLAAADFNGDGKLDLAVANRNSVTLTILLGDGQGNFSATLIGLGAMPQSVRAGDFNGDGKADLLVPQNNAGFVSVLLGNGAGEFSAPINTNVGGIPLSTAVADFNGDGKQDLALVKLIRDDNAENRIVISGGDGTGRFTATGELPLILARLVVAGDLNGDGLPDLVGININPVSGGGDAWSFLNYCHQPPSAALASVSAASFRRLFLAGESIVAAFGVGLSTETVIASTLPLPTQLAGTHVKVKDSAGVERLAPLFFVSPNQVNYLMPAGTAIGMATVTIAAANGNSVSSTTQIAAVAPGLFTANSNGQGAPAGVVLRVQGDGRQVYEPLARFDPVSNQFVPAPINLSVLGPSLDRVFLILFGTGMRGGAGTKVELMIGERKFDVLYAGPQGDLVGVDQINVEILRGFLPLGEYDVAVTVDGRVANPVRIALSN